MDETTDVGRDTGAPVTPDYPVGNNAFTGTVHWSALSATPAPAQGGVMPVEDNQQAARRFYEEVINARNVDALDELLTPDGVDHTFGSQNAEQAKHWGGQDMLSFLVQLGVTPGPGTPGPGTPA